MTIDQTCNADLPACLAGRSLLLLGEFMLDRYVWGAVERISPEAPVPVVLAQRRELVPGGAGNVARNAVALGGRVAAVGVVGEGAGGEAIRAGLAALGVDTEGLLVVPGLVTIEKTRVLAGHQQLLRIDDERPEPLAAAVEATLRERVAALLPAAEALVISDYGKGQLSPALVAWAIARGRAAGLPVLVDPKGRDFARYRGATVVTPNHRELATATGRPAETDAEVQAAGEALRRELDLDALLVTRGPAGMMLLEAGESPLVEHAQAREVFDVTGAGDTVLAVLALCAAAGLPLAAAARAATAAAGLAVGRVGTAVVQPGELAAALGS